MKKLLLSLICLLTVSLGIKAQDTLNFTSTKQALYERLESDSIRWFSNTTNIVFIRSEGKKINIKINQTRPPFMSANVLLDSMVASKNLGRGCSLYMFDAHSNDKLQTQLILNLLYEYGTLRQVGLSDKKGLLIFIVDPKKITNSL